MLNTQTLNIAAVKALVLAVAFLVNDARLVACSVYSPVNSAIMAANYDWTVSSGLIFVDGRGWDKQAFLASNEQGQIPGRWRSRYASLTLSQWGREFPMQGINERGLAGVVLNAPASYPENVPNSPQLFISEMQWLQFQLDNYATVAEVERNVRIFSIQKINASLHYFFCDATKDCGLIEFEGGRAVVHRGPALTLRAITNSSYMDSLQSWQTYSHENSKIAPISNQSLPSGYNSLNRVIRATWYSRHSSFSEVNLFNNLKDLGTSGWTNWHSVFAMTTQQLIIEPWQSNERYVIERSEFANDCNAPPKMRRIGNGKIFDWESYDSTVSAVLLARAAAPIGGFSVELRKKMIEYSNTFRCSISNKL